jgi:hypothetical protein
MDHTTDLILILILILIHTLILPQPDAMMDMGTSHGWVGTDGGLPTW